MGVIDLENVAIGDPAIDLATLRDLGDRFARAAVAYCQGNVPGDLDGRIGDLLAIRELLGLDHGPAMGEADGRARSRRRSWPLPESARRPIARRDGGQEIRRSAFGP